MYAGICSPLHSSVTVKHRTEGHVEKRLHTPCQEWVLHLLYDVIQSSQPSQWPTHLTSTTLTHPAGLRIGGRVLPAVQSKPSDLHPDKGWVWPDANTTSKHQGLITVVLRFSNISVVERRKFYRSMVH